MVVCRPRLGTDEQVTVTGLGTSWQVAWCDATQKLGGSVLVEVTQEKLPDLTVGLGEEFNDPHLPRNCVVIRTAGGAASQELQTSVQARSSGGACRPPGDFSRAGTKCWNRRRAPLVVEARLEPGLPRGTDYCLYRLSIIF